MIDHNSLLSYGFLFDEVTKHQNATSYNTTINDHLFALSPLPLPISLLSSIFTPRKKEITRGIKRQTVNEIHLDKTPSLSRHASTVKR